MGPAKSLVIFPLALLAWFQVTDKEGGPLLSELRSGRGLRAYLGPLAFGVKSAPEMEHLALLVVGWDREVHLLHSFLSVPVSPYVKERCLLDFRGGGVPLDGLPPISDIPVAFLVVWSAVIFFPREYPVVHI